MRDPPPTEQSDAGFWLCRSTTKREVRLTGRRVTEASCAQRDGARTGQAELGANPWVEPKINPGADDGERPPHEDGDMTTSEYLLNAAFVLLVLRQSRERALDRRSVIVPLVLMFFVAAHYLHTLPTAGNDLVLIVGLALAGLAAGLVGGFVTHVRAGQDGVALARVGWIAGGLLVLGIGARRGFAFAIGHGFEPAVRGFSIAHQIGAAAWPVALVLMALIEVGARVAVVQIRGRRLVAA
jgi:hypothetical protein